MRLWMRSDATAWVRANAVEINATRNTADTICTTIERSA